jgi:Ca2+-transporting ATPase
MDGPLESLLASLRTSSQTGLTSQEAARRLAVNGRNELTSEDDDPLWKKFAEMFKDPMISLLLASAIASVAMGHWDDAISIALAVLIVTVVAFVQEYRSEKAIAALQELVATTCSVKRDGHVSTIEASCLVVGDITVVRTGDRVAADARLTKAVQLEVDASTFTGEAVACARSVGAIAHDDGTIPAPVDRTDTILTGTTVRCGHGEAVVVATGMNSAFGDVYKLMQETEPSRSPLQLRMDDLGQLLTKFSFIVIFFIVVFGVVLSKRALFDMFQIAVSLAVAAIPEGLPIVVTVTLALGAHRMAQSKAIVKKLPAVESLGCAGVVCADKTGTFTCNEMTLSAAWSLAGAVGERGPTRCAFSGVGFNAEGEAAHSCYGEHIAQIVRVGAVCNNASIAPERAGQPTELALLYAAAKAGLGTEREAWERHDELAFSSVTKWMAVRCVPTQAGVAASGGASRAAWFIKGALETVAPFCSHFVAQTSGSSGLGLAPFTSRERSIVMEAAARMGGEGLRVLALAYGGADAASGAAARRPGAPGCACDFVFAGLVALRDPVRPGVPRAVALLGSSGVKVIMVTGDAKGTALAVAQEVGLYDATEQSARLAMSGTELDAVDFEHLSIAQLRAKLCSVRVFYRTTPRHKLALVTAFQQLGDVVAMTGDGVNDAPALKKADIGIAMGKSGALFISFVCSLFCCLLPFPLRATRVAERQPNSAHLPCSFVLLRRDGCRARGC